MSFIFEIAVENRIHRGKTDVPEENEAAVRENDSRVRRQVGSGSECFNELKEVSLLKQIPSDILYQDAI